MKLFRFLSGLVFFFYSALFLCSESSALNLTAANLRLKKEVKSLREIKDRKVVKQTLDYSCGPAGLATILHYHFGDQVTEKDIISNLLRYVDIEKVKRRGGFSLLDLKQFTQDRGYIVNGYKMDFDFIKDLDEPVLVPIKFKGYRHFVVIKDIIRGRVFFSDPALGNMSMKADRFSGIWQGGIGLVIKQNKIRDPFKSRFPYSIKVKADEINIAEYKSLMRIIERGVIRTAIFPSEF